MMSHVVSVRETAPPVERPRNTRAGPGTQPGPAPVMCGATRIRRSGPASPRQDADGTLMVPSMIFFL